MSGEQQPQMLDVTERPGAIVLTATGPHPSQPWQIILSPDNAYRIGQEMAMRALAQSAAGKYPVPAVSTSLAQPVRRPPSNQPQQPAPQRLPAPPKPAQEADVLLSDDFGIQKVNP